MCLEIAMEIRAADASDANDLFELNALFDNTTTVEQMKKSLRENDREIVCIAFCEGAAVGYCSGLIVESMCHSEKRADIEALYVREEYRKQGVGEALMRCLEELLALRGIRHFHINTYLSNKTAQLLYEKMGYAKTGEILMDKTAT